MVFLWYGKRKRKEKMKINPLWLIWTCLVILFGMVLITYAQDIDVEKLANAIFKAENSISHPYGIMTKYAHTTPRQACINTIKSALKRFNAQTKEKDFIHFLSLTYCPIGADNDNGTNKFWERNVKYFYMKAR